MDKRISIGTDVAHLVLFHPDDLQHRDHDPIAWYAYDFAYRKESAAGRLIAWGTGSDGGYLVRLTLGPLIPAEQARACPSWAFPLEVRHGKVMLDNTDALPGEEQMTDPDKAGDVWFELPHGPYRVTVHPIDRSKGSGPDLPDYVLTFQPVVDLKGIAVADTPPELRPYKDWKPRLPGSMEGEARFQWRAPALKSDRVNALAVPADMAILPTMGASMPASEAIAEVAFPEDWIAHEDGMALTPTLRPGALATFARVSGKSWSPDQGTKLSFQGTSLVRIGEIAQGPVLPRVRIALVEKPDMAVDDAVLVDFRARLKAAAASGRLATSSFELERMETLATAEGLTGWALMELAMPLETRLTLWAAPARERIAGITAQLGA